MRMQRIVFTLMLSIAATGAASSQDYRGTWEQQMACTGDVWRLCGAIQSRRWRIVSRIPSIVVQVAGPPQDATPEVRIDGVLVPPAAFE